MGNNTSQQPPNARSAIVVEETASIPTSRRRRARKGEGQGARRRDEGGHTLWFWVGLGGGGGVLTLTAEWAAGRGRTADSKPDNGEESATDGADYPKTGKGAATKKMGWHPPGNG